VSPDAQSAFYFGRKWNTAPRQGEWCAANPPCAPRRFRRLSRFRAACNGSAVAGRTGDAQGARSVKPAHLSSGQVLRAGRLANREGMGYRAATMALTQTQIDQVATWVRGKWTTSKCPMCSHNDWQLPGDVNISIVPEDGGVKLGGGPIIPCAVMVCRSCGNTLLVNLVVAGVRK